MNLLHIAILLVAYQLKHFLADYPLQTRYMLQKFKPAGQNWIMPLASHAAVHAAFTFFIVGMWVVLVRKHGAGLYPFAFATFDFLVHFTMDRIKASPHLLGRFHSGTPESMGDAAYVLRTTHRGMPSYRHAQRHIRHNSFFWWSLGFDQMVHHLTHYTIILALVLS